MLFHLRYLNVFHIIYYLITPPYVHSVNLYKM